MDKEHNKDNHLQENIENVDNDILLNTVASGVVQDLYLWKNVMSNWQGQRIQAVVQLLCYIVHLAHLLDIQALVVKQPSNIVAQRDITRQKLMAHLTRNERAYKNITRMSPNAFALLCDKLRRIGTLKDYRRAKPKTRKWMHAAIHNYDKLYELYDAQKTTGEYAKSAREKVQRWQRSSSQLDLNDSLDNFMSDSEGNWANDIHDNKAFNSSEYALSINSQETSSVKSGKRKASMMEMLETQYEKLNSGIERISEVLERGNVIAEKSLAILKSGRPHYYKEEEIYVELEMIGVHSDYVLDAYCYLSSNPSATRSFFGLSRARRLEWLMNIMCNM